MKHYLIFRLEHPYFDEIESFEPDEILLKPVEPRVIEARWWTNDIRIIFQFPQPIDQTKCLFVDTKEKLKTMIDHIEIQSELAIDLEVE